MKADEGNSLPKNISWLMVGNVGGTALMGVMVLLLPKLVPVETYGFWQLYVFYATYLGYFSFGIADGLYLRFSGRPLSAINPRIVSSHLLFLVPTITLAMGALAWGASRILEDPVRRSIVALACLSTLFYLCRTLLSFLYQAANRMELYAICLIIERSVFLGGTLALIAAGYHNLIALLAMDTLGRAIGLCYAMVRASEHVVARPLPLRAALSEVGASFAGGIFVSASSLATVLVAAVARWGADQAFGVRIFAEVALAFALVNMVQTVLNSVGMSLLPSIRRTGGDYAASYRRAYRIATPLMVVGLLTYPLVAWIMRWWLPHYVHLTTYLAALFPMLLTEAKARLLAIPFLQAARRERLMAAIMVGAVACAVAATWYSTTVLHSPLATVLSLTLAVFVRAFVLEFTVRACLDVEFNWRILLEIAIIIVFLWGTLVQGGWLGFGAYASLIALYLTTLLPGLVQRPSNRPRHSTSSPLS
ncbi:MAG: hypothetical protein Q4P36_05260 [Bowdeniella nasicola]|nr:hypothetical protein [Bowdeniella nasicola]